MAPPCAPCPLYPAWLERRRLTDSADLQTQYAAWVKLGGWSVLWGMHRLERRLAHRRELLSVLANYPGAAVQLVRSAIERHP